MGADEQGRGLGALGFGEFLVGEVGGEAGFLDGLAGGDALFEGVVGDAGGEEDPAAEFLGDFSWRALVRVSGASW